MQKFNTHCSFEGGAVRPSARERWETPQRLRGCEIGGHGKVAKIRYHIVGLQPSPVVRNLPPLIAWLQCTEPVTSDELSQSCAVATHITCMT